MQLTLVIGAKGIAVELGTIGQRLPRVVDKGAFDSSVEMMGEGGVRVLMGCSIMCRPLYRRDAVRVKDGRRPPVCGAL